MQVEKIRQLKRCHQYNVSWCPWYWPPCNTHGSGESATLVANFFFLHFQRHYFLLIVDQFDHLQYKFIKKNFNDNNWRKFRPNKSVAVCFFFFFKIIFSESENYVGREKPLFFKLPVPVPNKISPFSCLIWVCEII